MRKTKLIILPTKCLNRMGFLLLFLACPVIGDWGRIRPDTEMSQWSILLDKEGSCGLTRNSQQNEAVLDGSMEYQEVSGCTPQNDTPPTAGNFIDTEKSEPETYNEIQRNSGRRIARREIRARRTVSLDRRNALRHVENSRRNYRTIPQEYGRRNDARRLSPDRRVRNNNEVTWNDSQRRQKRETDMRRIENRIESRRMDEGRRSRRVENNDAASRRVASEMRRLSRDNAGNVESRNARERRERREDRRVVNRDRRSPEREVFQGRRRDSAEERRVAARRVEMRRDTSKERLPDGRRTTRRLTARREETRQGMTRTAPISDERRNERSFERREALVKGRTRRFAVDFSRKQRIRADISQKREFNAREKTARIDGSMAMEPRIARQKEKKGAEQFKWDFFGGIKNWFHRNANRESWVGSNDFATTCLVGATVYLLTARQIKAA